MPTSDNNRSVSAVIPQFDEGMRGLGSSRDDGLRVLADSQGREQPLRPRRSGMRPLCQLVSPQTREVQPSPNVSGFSPEHMDYLSCLEDDLPLGTVVGVVNPLDKPPSVEDSANPRRTLHAYLATVTEGFSDDCPFCRCAIIRYWSLKDKVDEVLGGAAGLPPRTPSLKQPNRPVASG